MGLDMNRERETSSDWSEALSPEVWEVPSGLLQLLVLPAPTKPMDDV